MHAIFRVGACLGCLVAMAMMPGREAVAATPQPDAGRVSPIELTFEASKLFMTARSTVVMTVVPAAGASTVLVEDEGTPFSARGAEVVHVTVMSTFRKRHSTIDLWLDAINAQVLQRDKVETGHKHYRRLDRFGVAEVVRWRREPRDASEIDAGPDGWNERSEERLPITHAEDASFTLPEGIFYLLQAHDLQRLRGGIEALVYSGGAVNRLQIAVAGVEQIPVSFVEVEGDGETRRDGDRAVLHVTVGCAPLDASRKDADFRFLGLEGDIDIYLDAETRVPVQVSGKIPPLGRVDVKLRRVVHGASD